LQVCRRVLEHKGTDLVLRDRLTPAPALAFGPVVCQVLEHFQQVDFGVRI
jgi:hypothetical protein